MSFLLKCAAVVVVASGISAFASAETIQLGSFATGASSLGDANTAMNYAGYSAALAPPSSGTANTFALAPTTVWTAPVPNSTWVGFAPTAGPVGTSNPNYGYYTFTSTFTATSSSPYSGSLFLMADDTAEVFLNGNLLMSFGVLGGDSHCADAGDSCLGEKGISINGLTLLSGLNANTLTFVVQQAGFGPPGGVNDPSGMDFDATLSSIPEPDTLLLLGTGLMGLAGAAMFRRNRRQVLCPTR